MPLIEIDNLSVTFTKGRQRVRAVRDGGGRLVFDDARLIPGGKLHIETETCFIDGVVAAVRVPEED